MVGVTPRPVGHAAIWSRLTVDLRTTQTAALQLFPTLLLPCLGIALPVLGGRQVVERRMQPLGVVEVDPAADDLPGPAQVIQLDLVERLARTAMEALQLAVRLRMIRADPDVLERSLSTPMRHLVVRY